MLNMKTQTVKSINTPNDSMEPSSSGMDRVVQSKTKKQKTLLVIVLTILCLIVLGYSLLKQTKGRALFVEKNSLVIAEVTQGIYEDFMPVRARVTPEKTVFLDAIEGGRVERILVEDGNDLTSGQLIVELSNTQLQLSVLASEARVAEQLNNIRTIELNLEQNRLKHKSNLVDIEYNIKKLRQKLDREKPLVDRGALNKADYNDTLNTLEWYKNRREITLESQSSDSKMQAEQLTFLKETGERLESNLAISKQSLENMKVKAPVPGRLSGFNIEIGQSIGKGERLGQIDTPDNYKLVAQIDEYYLDRIDIGQKAEYKHYTLTLSKIFPQVQNGRFRVEFLFSHQQPTDIRRGQTMQVKLTLGDSSDAKLIPNGAFYQDSGGKWLFVVAEGTNEAVRRSVRLGRRNQEYIEVIEGLELGEHVVVSPYTSYLEVQRIKYKD